MTTEAITDNIGEGQEPAAADPARSPDQQLSRHVTARVLWLQQGYLADRPKAVASMAQLRRAVTAEPGDDPSVWFDIFDAFPVQLLGHTDEPSTAERAAHAAITMFAVHQQSRSEPMHHKDTSLGAAVRILGRDNASEDATLRRFHALGTASSLPETLHHLRGLVTQLRGAAVGLDYGRLARDLRRLQHPLTAPGVRLDWGRAYYRNRPSKVEPLDAPPTQSPKSPGDER